MASAVVRMPTTVQGPASTTVTGMMVAVLPEDLRHAHLAADQPFFHRHGLESRCPGERLYELDLDVDAAREIELHQRVHRLGRGIEDVEQPLVGAHLELLARGLVHVRASAAPSTG